MNTEPIPPKLLRTLIALKTPYIVKWIAESENISYLDAMKRFYNSQTYHALEDEATKYWWQSQYQFFLDYHTCSVKNAD